MNRIIKLSLLSLGLLLCFNGQAVENTRLDDTNIHDIIIQISPPRCLSTASLRMWSARGDYQVLNEPFLAAFCNKSEDAKLVTIDWWLPHTLHSFQEVEDQIFHMAQNGPVFVKELSFVMYEYMLHTHSKLFKHPKVHIIFLIRNPHHVIISLYNKHTRIIDGFSYIVGFQPCYELYKKIIAYVYNKPLLLHAEDLYTQPFQTVENLCKALEVPFVKNMLQWESLDDTFTGIEWHEIKHNHITHYWHDKAMQSTKFITPTQYETDQNGNPTFSEISNESDRTACLQAYVINKQYYDLLQSLE